MKKILVLTTVHKWNDNRILFKEIESLKKLDAEIHYCCQHEKDTDFIENGVYFHPLPKTNSLYKRLFLLQYLTFIKIGREKFDIIHFHDPELIILMWIVKFLFNTKIVFDIHENVSESLKTRKYIPKILRNFVSSLYSLIEKMVISSFDSLIIAEKSYRKIYGEKAIEILNYPRIPEKTIDKDFTRLINFAYVGNITELRGIFFMLEIFKKIFDSRKNVKLFLIGHFSPPLLERKVEKFIKENNLEKGVVILGPKHILEVYKILEDVHIGFAMLKPIGNYIESLPTKIFDYMVSGIPVVVSNFDIYDEYVTIPNTGIKVKYGDIENSTKQIIEILDNKEKLRIMSDNGVILTNSKWNWLSQEKKLLQLYVSLLTKDC